MALTLITAYVDQLPAAQQALLSLLDDEDPGAAWQRRANRSVEVFLRADRSVFSHR
jgi:hypothetical protein